MSSKAKRNEGVYDETTDSDNLTEILRRPEQDMRKFENGMP